MSAYPGSSHITVVGNVTPGPEGNRGPTGPTGPRGPTGISLTGLPGATGSGITGGAEAPSGVSLFNFDGQEFFIPLEGAAGSSYEGDNPRGVLLLQGLTTNGFSVLYTDDLVYRAENQVIVQPDDLEFKLRTFKFTGSGFKTVSSNVSYINLAGFTYVTDVFLGTTGEILYVSSAGQANSIAGSNYNENQDLLSVALGPERMSIHNNQNVMFDDFSFSGQNLLGQSGLTGVAFFSVDYGAFNINNSAYQNQEAIKRAYTTLRIGVTGSDNLTFKFKGLTYSEDSKFVPQLLTTTNFGSCCFCEGNSTEIECVDYVSQSYCQNVGGSFNTTSCLQRNSSGDCYAEGACCLNGRCINSSLDKCIQYKGTFFPGEICSGGFECPNTCATTSPNIGKCCFRGFCFDLTQLECSQLPESTFTPGEVCEGATDPDCCSALIGACCELNTTTNEYECSRKHPQDCTGIFHGHGTYCEDVECCGKNFIENYYNSNTNCKVTLNQPCFPIGTKIGGGYLVGVVGMPSPCSAYGSPLTAYGQPLACRVYPRGEVVGSGSLTYPFKTCNGANGSNIGSFGAYAKDVNFEYFNRTKSTSATIDLNYSQNAANKCLLKYGVPYIQQTFDNTVQIQGISTKVYWNDLVQYYGSIEYNTTNGVFSYPIGQDNILDLSYIVTEAHTNSTSPLYKYLARQYYGENSIHMLWALIVAPEDAYNGYNIQWGMEEGRARIGGFNDEPITTFGVDGLLSTRMFDESSKENPRLWFRTDESSDTKAYDRFAFYNTDVSKRANWASSVNENVIENNINQFKQVYSEMWDTHNPENSCTKQISILNQSSYENYNDWYIPSITELNYIYNNLTDLNSGILLGGDTPIETGEYWSSTTISYLKSWNAANYLDYSSYVIQESPFTGSKNSKFRFTPNDYAQLTDKKAYELSLAVSAGEHMLTQNFDTTDLNNAGLVQSRRRRQPSAKLRPVRRIPIILGCYNDNITTYLVDSYFQNCNSCPSPCNVEF
jgi:hypothetical protein